MEKILISLLINFSIIIHINSYYLGCSKYLDSKPTSMYHCSGLNVTDPGDSHCCIWKYYDTTENTSVSRCSSISQKQFDDLDNYIERKKSKYQDLVIECTKDQALYCSNILFDQEHLDNCNLPIYDKKDIYCCRWKFKDNTNDGKKNSYCASINEYQYLTIEHYVDYKEMKGNGRYDDLEIDCFSRYITRGTVFYIFLLFVIL